MKIFARDESFEAGDASCACGRGASISGRVMGLVLSRILAWRRLSALNVVAVVLLAGTLTKLGHAWSAIAVLAILCVLGPVFQRLMAIWQADRARRATRIHPAMALKAQA
jgi:hypothetical protein